LKIISLNSIGRPNKNLILWFIWIRSPFSAIGAAATFTDQVRLHYITRFGVSTTNFESFQVFFLKAPLIAHVLPGTALIIHVYNVALHFGKRHVVTDNLLRPNTPQHFIVASHEPFFLILPVIMRRSHISGNGHNASFFNAIKAKIKGGFIAPVYRGNDTDPFGCPVGTAPTVAEHVVKLHNRSHFQIHAEIRGKYCPVAG
jgi:hypothetical protein